jgi:uncharacterized integral membrane protein
MDTAVVAEGRQRENNQLRRLRSNRAWRADTRVLLEFRCNRKVVVVVTESSNEAQTQNATNGGAEIRTTHTLTVARPVRKHLHLPRTRAGGHWVAVLVVAVALLLLLIFILQNGQRSDIYFLGAHGSPPMGAALVLSAIFGVLLVTLPAVVRTVQLRLLVSRRRDRRTAMPHAHTGADVRRS